MNRTRIAPPGRPATRPARWAAEAAAGLLGLVVLFQWAVVLGAPWGAITQGGGTLGQLSPSGRCLAAASSLLLLAMGGSVLARAGLGPMRSTPPQAITVMVWLTAFFSGLTVALNLVSPSANERAVWAPPSTVIFLLIIVTMLLTRLPGPVSVGRPGSATREA